jgi:mRNA capping enzyme, beta chain
MATMTLVTALKSAIHAHGHKSLELEFRLGEKQADGTFRTGIGRKGFENLRGILSASPAFLKSEVDLLEKLNGTDVRHVVENGNDHKGYWQSKRRVFNCDDVPYIRAAIAIESEHTQAPPSNAPPFAFFRRKKRESYTHKCWRVDLTRVTSNLPGNFDRDEEVYEVELELNDRGAFFDYTMTHLISWGYSFMAELRGFTTVT